MVNIVKIKNISIGDGKFVLFGGPCMAETLETCLKTAEFLKKVCQDLDIQYVNNLTFINDLKIVLKTIKVVFKREGISSVASQTMEKFTGTKE